MNTQILPLQAPYDYIYCNGEVGKHIATLIVSETGTDAEGRLQLTTHSYPVVKYWNAPQGVVWDKAELTDCVVLCDDSDKRVDVWDFCLMCNQHMMKSEEEDSDAYIHEEYYDVALELKDKLSAFGIAFKTPLGGRELRIDAEINKCREGYYVNTMSPSFININIVEPTQDELLVALNLERNAWEQLFDYVVDIRFEPQSSMASELHIENL